MIRFKHFFAKNNIPIVPNVVHGTHAKKKTPKIPIIPRVVHGTHAQRKSRKQSSQSIDEAKKSTKPKLPEYTEEDRQKDQAVEKFLLAGENDHLHPRKKMDGVDSMNHLENVFRKRYSAKKLSSEQKQSLLNYSFSSGDLNGGLIERAQDGLSGPHEEHKEDYDNLMSVVNNNKLPRMKVFSGIGFNPSNIGKPTDDGHLLVHSPAFISASLSKHIAHGFASSNIPEENQQMTRHMLRIHVPEGHPGYYIGNDEEKSENPHEYETLLPPNTVYKIHKTPQVFEHTSFGGKYAQLHIWDAHPVPPGEDPETWQPPGK